MLPCESMGSLLYHHINVHVLGTIFLRFFRAVTRIFPCRVLPVVYFSRLEVLSRINVWLYFELQTPLILYVLGVDFSVQLVLAFEEVSSQDILP